MDEDVFYRKSIEFFNYKQFDISNKNYNHQYFKIYALRLANLKNELIHKAKLKWMDYNYKQLSDLNTDDDNFCVIVGIIYKNQEFKPSILRELSEELEIKHQPNKLHYASNEDYLFLEDETLRVKLVGEDISYKTKEIVTGLICALLGKELADGSFWVKEWCFPGCCPKSLTSTISSSKNEKILIISGLDFWNNPQNVSLNLLLEWVTGMIGDSVAQREQASILHILIAGNSVKGTVETYSHKGYVKNKVSEKTFNKESVQASYHLDKFLACIAQTCNITLMPGEFDPVSHMLPQQPIHFCILPQVSKFKTFHGVTNPWVGKIGSKIIAGSSGQPIRDIMKVAGLIHLTPLEWLEKTLTWRHYAPTAPDTLPTYPYFDKDPFIMTLCPDIYFVGNMDSFDTKLFTDDHCQVRLISVPSFSKTQMAVIVDLTTLHTTPISFGCN